MTYQSVLIALADPTRRKIFEALGHAERTVTELARSQPISGPAVSQHLKVLRMANLVKVRPQGTRNLYSMKREGLEELRQYLNTFWSDALDAFGAEVERRKRKEI